MKKFDEKTIKNHLVVLGLGDNISIRILKDRFRELSKKHHPDFIKNNNDEKMSEINTAYKELLFYLENVKVNLFDKNYSPVMDEEELWNKKFGEDFFFGGS